MPEIKNTFIKSKMNKDLDDRLMPPGEYRDAQNISISRSEDADVGALENVLGNIIKSDFDAGEVCNGLDIIGYYMDVPSDRVFVMMTNYTDNSIDKLSNFATTGSHCSIREYNIKTGVATTLVNGRFLNFSKTHPIHHINLLEDLLFWTDDRNQPRKINIELAKGRKAQLTGSSVHYYYTTEDQISVAKYYPHKPIDLIRVIEDVSESTMKDRVSEYLPNSYPPHLWSWDFPVDPDYNEPTHGYGYGVKDPGTASVKFNDGIFTNVATTGGVGTGLTVNIKVRSSQLNPWNGLVHPTPLKHEGVITDIEVNNPGSNYVDGDTISVDGVANIAGGIAPTANHLQAKVYGTNIEPSNNPDYYEFWPGDPSYLRDKFLRFSYRFKFDDGEYSLMAPFTQIAFIPEQDGYFIENDENRTYQSTEVNFFRNKVNDINLIINAPDDMTFSSLYNDLKVIEIDILARESDGLAVKVLDTIKRDTFKYLDPVGNHTLNNTGVFEYNYQSRKPYKTLPERDTIRVYDKIPVRALTQEIVSNRVVYGNYKNKHTPPDYIDYNVLSSEKLDEDPEAVIPSYNIKEYPNHTLKQNRTYQVGIVLSDRYGRQSTVILSSVDTGETVGNKHFGGSTIYHPYRSSKDPLITPAVGSVGADTWPGDSLQVLFNQIIKSTKSSKTGEPGLYDENINPLGWYSYKVVVKQQEQDYYNIYFPGILNGTLNKNSDGVAHKASPSEPVCYITLQGDNINKVPRDLKNVGPDQKIFRTSRPNKTENPLWYSVVNEAGEEGAITFDDWNSQEARNFILQRNIELGLTEPSISENASVEMHCRVENIRNFPSGFENKQFDPGFLSDTVVNIGTLSDLGMIKDDNLPVEIYNVTSDPLLAQLEVQDYNIGVSSSTADPYYPKRPILAVYETKPVTSRLRLFWETTTSGLVSELNKAIIEGVKDQPQEIVNWGFCKEATPLGALCLKSNFPRENMAPYPLALETENARVTRNFYVEDAGGNKLTNATIYLEGVVDQTGTQGYGANADYKFEIAEAVDLNSNQPIPGEFYIYLTDYEWFGENANRRVYTFRLFAINASIGALFEVDGGLGNTQPFAGHVTLNVPTSGLFGFTDGNSRTAAHESNILTNDIISGSNKWVAGGTSLSNPTRRFADKITYWDLLPAANGTYIDDTDANFPSDWIDKNWPRAHNELNIKVTEQVNAATNAPVNYFYISGSGGSTSPGSWKDKQTNNEYPYAWLTSDFTNFDGLGGDIFKVTVEWSDCSGSNGTASNIAIFHCQVETKFELDKPTNSWWLDLGYHSDAESSGWDLPRKRLKGEVINWGNEIADFGNDIRDGRRFITPANGIYNFEAEINLSAGWHYDLNTFNKGYYYHDTVIFNPLLVSPSQITIPMELPIQYKDGGGFLNINPIGATTGSIRMYKIPNGQDMPGSSGNNPSLGNENYIHSNSTRDIPADMISGWTQHEPWYWNNNSYEEIAVQDFTITSRGDFLPVNESPRAAGNRKYSYNSNYYKGSNIVNQDYDRNKITVSGLTQNSTGNKYNINASNIQLNVGDTVLVVLFTYLGPNQFAPDDFQPVNFSNQATGPRKEFSDSQRMYAQSGNWESNFTATSWMPNWLTMNAFSTNVTVPGPNPIDGNLSLLSQPKKAIGYGASVIVGDPSDTSRQITGHFKGELIDHT